MVLNLVAILAVALVITACVRQKQTPAVDVIERGPSNIDDLLDQSEGLDVIFALQEKIAKKEGESGYDSLTEAEKIFLCVEAVENEVNNGGFHQYFFNSAGDSAQDAPAAFMAIGADYTAELVSRACAVFPGGEAPRNRGERQDLLEEIGYEADETLGKLDDAFYEYQDDIAGLLLKYVKENRNQFE